MGNCDFKYKLKDVAYNNGHIEKYFHKDNEEKKPYSKSFANNYKKGLIRC